jgi:hypothetical protein
MASALFIEIEHKFIVDSDFNQAHFLQKLARLAPSRQSKVSVRDTYYVLGHDRSHVYRHRFDKEIQQLTVKSVESDAAVRTEINIPIDQSKGDQQAAVSAFMEALGAIWSGELAKDIQVAYFADCEVVFYRASNGNDVVYCVEFEAINPTSVEEGLGVLAKYEHALGFDPNQRDGRSLFELLLVGKAPPEIKAIFLKH